MPINRKMLFIILMIITVSFIGLYAGHFLLEELGWITPFKTESTPSSKAEPSPVKYTHISTILDGNKQEIHVLEINPQNKRVHVKPALSYDSVFGFEKLSIIALRSKAYAAITGGFFYQYGQPQGLIIIDGRIISNNKSSYPSLIIEGGKACLREIDLSLKLLSGNKTIKVDKLNTIDTKGNIVLYTPEYGTDNRANTNNYTYTIRKSIVTEAARCKSKTLIPDDGMLVTLYASSGNSMQNSLPFNLGEKVELVSEPSFGDTVQAYGCGCWIVKDGKAVIGKSDPWIGVLTNRDPRTAVGIKQDGTLVLVTVDGRQPDYSIGLTGKELADFLLSMGIVNAAMLDGGASAEMIVESRIVNKPSFKGQERLLGGGIVVKIDN